MRIPVQLIFMDIVGTVLAALGLAGLFTDMSRILPVLANRELAGMIAGVGFALMTFSVLKIIRILRARH
ncbi:MAG: hypothetical protein KIS79_10905 [Burkholderiales bacterium]|nr:hypothetical protein [Burkholderiales bacterium]